MNDDRIDGGAPKCVASSQWGRIVEERWEMPHDQFDVWLERYMREWPPQGYDTRISASRERDTVRVRVDRLASAD
jgi:hypothetical protein